VNRNPDAVNAQLSVIGVVTTATVALTFAIWSFGVSNPLATLNSLVLGLGFQLFIWRLSFVFQSYGLSLLCALAAAIGLSFIPMSVYFLYLAVAVLITQFLIHHIHNRISELGYVVGLGAFFGLMIFASTERWMGDAFIGENIRQFALNPDTLFHASMATMFKEYNTISTGLHGLVQVHYHFLSHLIYGRTAALLNLEPFEVYGYSNFITFAPLLIAGLLHSIARFSGSLAPLITAAIVAIGGPLSQTFGWQWNSYFVSESYLTGLILLMGLMDLVADQIDENPAGPLSILAALIYLPLITTAKISVGLIATCTLGIAILRNRSLSLSARAITILGAGVLALSGYILARIPPIEGLEVKFDWGWFQREHAHDGHLAHFLIATFPFVIILLPALVIQRRSRKFETCLLYIGVAAIIGFLGLNITIASSGYYFSNVHYFLAAPVFALLLSEAQLSPRLYFALLKDKAIRWRVLRWIAGTIAIVTLTKYIHGAAVILVGTIGLAYLELSRRRNRSAGQATPIYPALIMTFLLCNGLFFLVKVLPKQIRRIVPIRAQTMKHLDYANPYENSFKTVRGDQDKHLMVYIPKTESSYWDNADISDSRWVKDQCANMPFYAPILTGRPAVFGLPIQSERCNTFHRGYEAYSREQYSASAKPEYTEAELCGEVVRLGFKGYYKITKDLGPQKTICNQAGGQ
jgi:hypothetical protein